MILRSTSDERRRPENLEMLELARRWTSPGERRLSSSDQPDTAVACRADNSAGWSGLVKAGLMTASRLVMMATTSAMSPPPRKQVVARV